MDEQKLDRQEEGYIDLSRLLHEFWSVLRRMFWLPLALMVLVGGLWLLRGWISYTPMYASEVTFTIHVNSASTSDFSGSYSYYEKTSADQLSKTFPYLVQSDYFQLRLRQAMGVEAINGSITAATIPDTNLFTMRVTSPDPDDALAILEAVVEVYPQAADYVVGSTGMELLTQPTAASEPYNSFRPLRTLCKGGLLGLALGLALLLAFAAVRRTVRTPEDVQRKLNQQCLGTLPAVTFKRRKSGTGELLTLQNPHIPAAYLEGTRSLRIKLLRLLSEANYKTILITSTMPGEGKTTVATNLALSLSRNGARVILIDADLRKPSVKRALGVTKPSAGLGDALSLDDPAAAAGMLLEQEPGSLWLLAGDSASQDTRRVDAAALRRVMNALGRDVDYVIVDTPPCGLLADSMNIARAADCVLYVLGADAVPLPQVLDGIQFLDEVGTPLLGCILNGVTGGSHGGYGYGSYGGYGYGYGGYGYGYSHRGKSRAPKETQ